MKEYLFTSESVTCGHPDKVADQISDKILDACLQEDAHSKVACESLVGAGLIVLAGEMTSRAQPNFQGLVRDVLEKIGYTDSAFGLDFRSCGIIVSIVEQSLDIAQGVKEGKGLFQEMGAGDQGMMFGFACDETDVLMPLPITLCHAMTKRLKELRETKDLPYLRPDGKVQVTVEYFKDHRPKKIHTVVISTQHDEEVSLKKISEDMKAMAHQVIPNHLIDEETRFFVNPTGRFVLGGPASDCGLTGRKIIVDTYGGMGRHGGGCFSGKDPSKVDRSAAYAARYVAKNVVAAGLAKRCEVQLSYAIGVPYPISIKVDTFGTGTVCEGKIASVIPEVFSLSPKGIIEMLDLWRPIYFETSFGGHFGREEPNFTWEKVDKANALKEAFGLSL